MWFRTGTASTSASTSSLLTTAAALLIAATAVAGPRLDTIKGHLGLGYAKLLNPDAPTGSLAIAAGVDAPVRPSLRAGVDVGFVLLGSTIANAGSQTAGVDWSLFEAFALAHWTPSSGPWLVSFGPGMVHARASLATSAPASFDSLAVDENALGAAVAVGYLPRRDALVTAGVELGVRTAWLEKRTWTIGLARLVVYY